MPVSKGDQFYRTLPPWINGGRTVIVTVTKVLTPFGRDSYNGHDVLGNWTDEDGIVHRGKFYLKDLTPIDTQRDAESELRREQDNTQPLDTIVTVLFAGGGEATLFVPPDSDIEDEIAEWCRFHGIAEDNVADFIIEGEIQAESLSPPY